MQMFYYSLSQSQDSKYLCQQCGEEYLQQYPHAITIIFDPDVTCFFSDQPGLHFSPRTTILRESESSIILNEESYDNKMLDRYSLQRQMHNQHIIPEPHHTSNPPLSLNSTHHSNDKEIVTSTTATDTSNLKDAHQHASIPIPSRSHHPFSSPPMDTHSDKKHMTTIDNFHHKTSSPLPPHQQDTCQHCKKISTGYCSN